MRPTNLLTDSRIVFATSIVFGLLVPSLAAGLSPLIVPSLVVMMTLSLAQVSSRHAHEHHERRTILGLVLVNYLVAGLAYAALAFIFVSPAHRAALYMLALVPPAVGVLPLARFLHADMDVAFIAEFVGYLAALILIPFGTLLLFGEAAAPLKVARVLLIVIVLPFAISRLLRRVPSLRSLCDRDGVSKGVINIAYGVSFAAVVGLNRAVLLEPSLITVALVLIAVKFGSSTIAWLWTVHRMPRRIGTLYMLFSSLKNGGAAIAIVVLLFGTQSTAALAINAIIVPFHILYMENLAGA